MTEPPSSASDAIAFVLAKLEDVRKQSGYWMARCPAHEDRQASLSIAAGTSQPVVLKCQAGCETRDVLAAAGLTLADISAEPHSRQQDGEWTPRGPAVAVYSYVDEQARVLFEVCRTADKQFPQRRPDPAAKTGWSWKLGTVRRVPYHLPQLLAAIVNGETVYVVEGEKDVHAIEAAGGTATCNPGGAGKWRPEYDEHFRGADVVIVADRDQPNRQGRRPGADHAQDVASHLRKVAKSVEVVEAVTGKDAADHLHAGYGLSGFRRVGQADTEAEATAGQAQIQIGSGPATIRAVVDALTQGDLPEIYVSDGQIVHLEEVSGPVTAGAGHEDSPLPVTASPVNAPLLARLLAQHAYVYQEKTLKGVTTQEEATPTFPALSAALAGKTWRGVKPFRGIVGAPVLRPDGTLLQQPGYDEATGLYLASKVPHDPVPDAPTAREVAAALSFLLDKFLKNFPWVSDADRANYIGALVTPILQRFLRTLTPFVVYTATMPGSGKTILTCGPGMLYGQRVLTWTHSDEELRKSITSVLADPAGTVIFDNLTEGTVINSPVLARLITDRTWADRLLGKNITASYANDRLWSATGNNLLLGGDMATRTVLVRLNPNVPRPEERTNFAIPNLDDWILRPANQRTVLRHLLILVVDWTRNGAPRAHGITMRQFTPWAEAVGGFLSHHGIKDFLGNIQSTRDIDDENATWTSFLSKWRSRFPESDGEERWISANELRKDAEPRSWDDDPWDGQFLTDFRGKIPSVVGLGKKLRGHIDRFHGSFVLRSRMDPHSKVRYWRVEEFSE